MLVWKLFVFVILCFLFVGICYMNLKFFEIFVWVVCLKSFCFIVEKLFSI